MKKKFNRRSLRIKGFNYTKWNIYFVTICLKNRKRLFGEIIENKVHLSILGEIANNHWLEIPNHFKVARIISHVIMPDHMHGLIEIRPCRLNINDMSKEKIFPCFAYQKLTANSISSILRSYKASVTKKFRDVRRLEKTTNNTFQNNLNSPIWQRNFSLVIIKNDQHLKNVKRYIEKNPENG